MVIVDYDDDGEFYLCEVCNYRYNDYDNAIECERSCSNKYETLGVN